MESYTPADALPHSTLRSRIMTLFRAKILADNIDEKAGAQVGGSRI
jgi:hypothetical protein